LPYWTLEYGEKPHLIIPCKCSHWGVPASFFYCFLSFEDSLTENDMRFVTPHGFAHGGEFSKYLKDHLK
jgi:hypothetical protein